MNEYLSELYDWISSQDTTFQGRRSREEFISKMQDDADYNQQMYTWISGVDATFKNKYTTDAFQTKTGLKKKDEFQPTSQEVATESTIKEEKQPTLSDASESKFDYESFIDKDEEEAIYDLQSQLTAKGYSVEETGIGDALLVTDNITGEVTEIDLQPIQFFKGTRFEGDTDKRAQEIEKVKKLIQTPSDSRRSLLSTNQLEAYTSDKASYLQNLKNQYPDFQFEYVQDPQKGGTIRIIKGDAVGEFQVTRGTGDESKQFTEINNFLYQNMTDEEASALNSKRKIDEFRRIEEDIKNINADIDVSMESAEAGFYDKNYFKGLFKALEAAGVSIPEDARRELEGGEKVGEYNVKLDKMMTSSFDRNDIESGIQKYFGSDPATMEKIKQYNLAGTIAVRKQKIDRAKKLAIENYYEDRPDRDGIKEIVRQVQKDLTDQEANIFTNVEMAKGDLQKMISGINQEMQELSERNPGVQFEVITNEDGVLQNIISSEPVDELEEVKNRIKNATTAYRTLAEKSKYELEKINSKSETVDQFMEAANRNYNLFDTSMADLKNAFIQLGGGIAIIQTLAEGAIEDVVGVPVKLTAASSLLPADVKMKMIRGEMAESREKVQNFYKTKRTYDEAISEGSKFEFGVRTFAEQAPNIALAIGTSGVGSAVGLSSAAVSTLVATQFGLTSAGQKYDELTTRQEFGAVAEKALKELESLKGIISDDEYLMQKYELERALEDSKISSTEKTLSVIGTGLVEGVVTRFIGTVPNSIKVLKDLKAPTNFMDDILRSNYTAAKQAVKEFGKRTGGEIIEETSIDLLTQINDYAFLGDQIDLSSLDDVAVTSIITSGAMNTPSTAYSTIMTQTNVNRYKNKINSLTQEIGTLKDMLMDPDISNIQRTAIHNNISNLISGIAEQTTNMEGDALLMGADNIKEMLTLSGVRNSMLKKAGVENDDSYDVANVKIDNYLKGLDQDAAKKFTDQMKYIDNRRNQITQSINYEGAVDRVFGEKGTEVAKDLDPTLTPQQKYTEVYKQVRQEINDNALKEFNDAIQKQEAGDISDAKPAEGVQKVEEEVRVTPEQKAEVDERAYKPEEVKETTDTAAFAASQQEAIAQRVEDKLQVTPVTQEDAQAIVDEGGKLFMTEDGKAGAYVKKDGYMGGLFKQPGADRTQAAKVLQDARIEAGGKFFDAFGINVESGKGTNLEDIYIKNGFRPIARMTFNPEFAPKGWEKTNLKNRPDNVFFVYDPGYKATKGEGQRIENYDQAYELAKNFSPEAAKVEGEVQQLRDMFKAPDQRKQVENAEKALKAVAPDVKIVVHESEQAYAEATNEQNRAQKTAGEYNPQTKTIHINPEKANVRTVAHETFHAILLNMVKTDTEAQRVTEAMIKAVAKVASPELKAYLDDFASNYSENIRAEEKLAELVGKLASEYDSLPKPTQSVVKRWLDRLAKMFGLKPFTDDQVIDVLNTIAGKVARGEAITESDVSAISEGASTFFNEPTTINKKQVAGEVKVSDTPADLSFVTSKDIIDIDGLVNDISSKGQKVWFWVADQLGRGIYNDTQVGTEHFLDAGPSFALDPKNRAKKAIWATGKGEAEVSKLINKSDYIFIMSGSPIKSKLFNKRVLNILKDRVGDYNAFKEGALNAKPTKPFRDVLGGHDSWESLTESPDRKKLLNAIESVKEKKDTPLKTFLQDNNAFIDLNDLRDGFYSQNDFQMNDVMLVLKPTAFGGKSDHSTYENDILGDVVGVPNKKVNAYDLMPDDVKQKYSDAMTESQKAQVVAPYGIGVKGISPRKQIVGKKARLSQEAKENYYQAIKIEKEGKTPQEIRLLTGWERGRDKKWRYEIFDGEADFIQPLQDLQTFKMYKLKDVLDFPELYELYPDAANMEFQSNPNLNAYGLYQENNARIILNANSFSPDSKEAISTLLHEVQHAIQAVEGFGRGINPRDAKDRLGEDFLYTKYTKLNPFRKFREILGLPFTSTETLNKAMEDLKRVADKSDFEVYRRAAGEVESRNVEARRTMTEAERLKTLLSETEDIAREDQYIVRKQQVTNNEIIQRAKEAGISDAAIREYLKERGMSPESADRAVKKYNDKVRLEAQKKEGIKVVDNKTLKGLDRILKFLTSARAYAPKSMQVAKESRNGYIEANTKKAKFTLNKLEKEIKKYKGDKVSLMADIDAFLRGDDNVALPDNIQKIANQMRTHIDTLSLSLLESGAVSDVAFDDLTTAQKKELIKQFETEEEARKNYTTSKQNVLNNIGSYLTRSYEVYSNKNWKDKVAQEVVDKAKNYLKEQMRPAAEKQAKEENRPVETVLQENVDALVDSLLDRDQAKAFISNANDASKNLGILRGRKDIPAELRALMGEYTSPAMNYIISVNKVATLTAQQNFLNKIKEVGEGVFFFKDDKTKGFRTKIAAEGTETMSPLNGLYTSPEIAEALKGGSVIGVNLGPLQPAVDFYLKSVGLVKYNKTILSPGTHAKNFLGNMFFMLANGHIDPRDYYNAAKVVGNDLFGGKREDLNNKLLEYIEAGVINQSVTLRDLRDMMSGKENRVDSMEDFEKRMMQRFNKPTWTKLKSKPESWYQAEDDYFKILAYEANKARYSKALFGKPFDQLNEKQKAEVKKAVTEIVKNTLPNYDRLPEVRKLMRAVPLAGTFISFHIEAIRTAWNTLDVAKKELANPKTRSIGIKRLSGIMALIGLKTFVLSSLGIGDEDDELEKSVRTFLPPWSTNSSIVIESAENGIIKYRDLSASDPWGVVDRAFIGYMSGEDSIDGFINSLDEVFGPFVEPDILFNALSTIRGKIDKDQPFSQNADIVMKELYKVLSPGVLTSGERILLEDKKSLVDLALGQEVSQKKQGRLNEFIGQVSGYKIREVKVEDAIFFKFRDIASAGIGKSDPGSARTAASLYNRTWYQNQEGEATEEQLQTAYEKSNKAYKDAMAEAVKYYQDALKLGVTPSVIEAKMKSAGFRKQEIESLSQGVIPELKQKEPELSEYEKMLRKRTRRKK